jgi:hypothetical protein
MGRVKKGRKPSAPEAAELTAIQSNLGFSYLHAIVSRVGGSCAGTPPTADNMGIDVSLTFQGEFSPKPVYRTISINGQLKTTRQVLRESKGRISYSLDSKQYNKYIQPSRVDFLLLLFVLPEDSEKWLELTPQELILRKCCYWTSLKGAPPSAGANVTVYFLEKNLFDVDQLRAILAKLSTGERLYYEP